MRMLNLKTKKIEKVYNYENVELHLKFMDTMEMSLEKGMEELSKRMKKIASEVPNRSFVNLVINTDIDDEIVKFTDFDLINSLLLSYAVDLTKFVEFRLDIPGDLKKYSQGSIAAILDLFRYDNDHWPRTFNIEVMNKDRSSSVSFIVEEEIENNDDEGNDE